jgi:UDP-N-acetyl-D-mannosaminuronic acid transferase (WecB/TagA/CpsF family)
MIETILGIPFLNGPVDVAVSRLAEGGLMLVPSAPTLTLLDHDESYRAAARGCDFAIVDSAYLAMLWWALRGTRLHRVSGLKFLRAFLKSDAAKQAGALFLVNPTNVDGYANIALLQAHGFEIDRSCCYTAPSYKTGNVVDPVLVERLETQRPRYVMLNVGGGTQEPLGLYLKQNLSYLPGIICTGAAIAFVTGRQARIPDSVDAVGLGWLARTLDDPRRFMKRYVGSLKLAPMVARFGSELPPVNGVAAA